MLIVNSLLTDNECKGNTLIFYIQEFLFALTWQTVIHGCRMFAKSLQTYVNLLIMKG